MIEDELRRIQEERERLTRVLEPLCGGVSLAQMGRIAMISRVTGDYVQYLEHRFVDAAGMTVGMTPGDIVGSVEWLAEGETLADFMTRIGRVIEKKGKSNNAEMEDVIRERDVLREERDALVVERDALIVERDALINEDQ